MTQYENKNELVVGNLQENVDLSLLRINSYNAAASYPPCSSCGCNFSCAVSSVSNAGAPASTPTTTMKRSSPESSLSTQPKSKKLFSHQEDANLSPLGFSKISLPFASFSNPTHTLNPSTPVLHRSISDPYPSYLDPSCGHGSGEPTQSPIENPRIEASNQETAPVAFSAPKGSGPSALPPLPPSLRRSASDPNPSPANTFSMGKDSIKEESPDTKRLRRMKERMKQMSKWCKKVLQDSEDAGPEQTHEDNLESESEEAVSVEKVGESLIVHFKCPCSKAYQILLSGGNCYYKLM